MLMEIIITGVMFLASAIGGFFSHSFLKQRKMENFVKNYESYLALLQFHMDKAYEIIHKDQILVYSIEATTLTDKDFHKASVDFINLVIKLLGPALTKEMTALYGDYDTLVFNFAEYFNRRYDEDEIRKKSISDMMESDVDTNAPEVPYALR
jgi:hypothetical protein